MVPALALDRLAREDEFRRVYREGSRFSTALLILHARPNSGIGVRLGLVVGRRFGRAVERNRLRRRLREVVRAYRQDIVRGVDLVVVPRKAAAQATHGDLREAVWSALEGVGLLHDRYERGRER